MRSHVERETVYFRKAGKLNTEQLLELAGEYARREGISDVVIASTTGETGAKASRIFKGCNLVVVTHSFGFHEPGTTELEEIYRSEIVANGARIFTGTHALSGVERAIRKNFQTIQLLELIANTLRLLGEGTKVCVEVTLMATDAGLLPEGKDVIAIAGTGRGADTALRLRAADSARFFNIKIREIVAKPLNF